MAVLDEINAHSDMGHLLRVASFQRTTIRGPRDRPIACLLARRGFYVTADGAALRCTHCQCDITAAPETEARFKNLLELHRESNPECPGLSDRVDFPARSLRSLQRLKSKMELANRKKLLEEGDDEAILCAGNDASLAKIVDLSDLLIKCCTRANASGALRDDLPAQSEIPRMPLIHPGASSTITLITPAPSVISLPPVTNSPASSSRRRTITTGNPTNAISAGSSVIIDRKNPDFTQLRLESVRLETFHDWPTGSPVSPRDAAKAGLFYTGEGDRVRCAFCRNAIINWAEGDEPMAEHRKHFGRCSFVRGVDVGNVTIGAEAATAAGHSAGGERQQNTVEGLILREQAPSATAHPPPLLPVGPGRGVRRAPPRPADRPKHPEYAEEERRNESFRGKQAPRGQNTRVLANAGFFHIGAAASDAVACFYCGGTLKRWSQNEDPWLEHAKNFPRCGFLRTRRDPGYMRVAQQTLQAAQPGSEYTASSGANAQGNSVSRSRGEADVNNNSAAEEIDEFEARRILAENKALWRTKTCVVCLDSEVSVVFLPCGHYASCINCAPSLARCPVCRADIRGTVRVFLT